MLKRILSPTAVFFAALGCFSAACFGAPHVSRPAPRTLTIRLSDEPETLDWNKARTTVETYLLMNMMEGLVSFNNKLQVVPALAKSWTISPDGKTYTFKLRPGVKWTDGVPLKAQDFVFSWRRLLSPVTAAAYAEVLFDVVGARDFHEGKLQDPAQVGVKALNDETLQVRLIRPVSHWLDIPTFWVTYPLRKDVVDKYGDGWATPGRIVTLGPYRLVSHDVGQQYVLETNRSYYGKHGNVQRIVMKIEKDNNEAMKLYDAGKLDFITGLSPSRIRNLAGRADLKSFPYLSVDYLGFSTNRFPVDSPNFRRAIAMSIDRAQIAKLVYDAKPATSFVPPPLLGSSDSLGIPFDPAKAKQELKKAGVDPFDHYQLNLILPNWHNPTTVAKAIREQLQRNLGIQVKVTPMPNRSYHLQLDLHGSALFTGHWGADYPDADNFLSIFLNDSGKNRFSWENTKFRKLILDARASENPIQRKKLYLSAQKILLEDQVVAIPLYYEPKTALVKPRVHGLVLNPLNYLLLRDVHLDPPAH